MQEFMQQIIKDKHGKITVPLFLNSLETLIKEKIDINKAVSVIIKKKQYTLSAIEIMVMLQKPLFLSCLFKQNIVLTSEAFKSSINIICKRNKKNDSWGTNDELIISLLNSRLQESSFNMNENVAQECLYVFIKKCDIVLIKELLTKEYNFNIQDSQGYTPLIYAIQYGTPEIVALLCEKNIRFSALDINNETFVFLLFALQHKKIEMAIVLLDYLTRNIDALIFPDINDYSQTKKNIYRSSNKQTKKFFKKNNESTLSNLTQVKSILWASLILALKPGYEPFLKKLLETNTSRKLALNLNKPCVRLPGESELLLCLPSEFAARCNNINALKCLFEADTQTDPGTALLYAAVEGNCEIMEFLIAHGSSLELEDAEGRNALILSVVHKKKENIPFLKQKGIEIDKPFLSKKTRLRAIHFALIINDDEIIIELCKAGACLTLLKGEEASPLTAIAEKTSLLCKLLESHLIPQKELISIFGYAIKYQRHDILKLLKIYAFDVMISSLFELAISSDPIAEQSFKLLLEHFDYFEILNKNYVTPISLAINRAISTHNSDILNTIIENVRTKGEMTTLKHYLNFLSKETDKAADYFVRENISQPLLSPLKEKITALLQELDFSSAPIECFDASSHKPISSHSYLQKQLGWTPEKIKEAKEKAKNSINPSNTFSFFQPEEKNNSPKIAYTWFEGELDRREEFKQIEDNSTSSTNNNFLWIPDKEVFDLGCPPFLLNQFQNKSRYVFKDDNIKPLSEIFTQTFEINGKIFILHALFELKIPDSPARILLFKIPSDNKDATLWAGLRFLENGLHETADMKKLKASCSAAPVKKLHLPSQKIKIENDGLSVSTLSQPRI